MQQGATSILAFLIAATVALAGCSSSGDSHKHDPVVCPDGHELSGSDVGSMPDHHAADFNATDGCPIPPSVTLTGLPATLNAYKLASFTWAINNASVEKGHSMLASLRWSEASVPDSDLTSMEVYPVELLLREHQELPVSFDGTLSFTQPGMVYIRAYAQIQGDEFERADFWSAEVAVEILEAASTGVVKDIRYGAGDILGQITPANLTLELGDGARLVNDDVQSHSCTSLTPGNPGPLSAGSRATGTAVTFLQPGVFEYKCDGLQTRSVDIRVNAPA